jgi:hypothetical protein
MRSVRAATHHMLLKITSPRSLTGAVHIAEMSSQDRNRRTRHLTKHCMWPTTAQPNRSMVQFGIEPGASSQRAGS